MKRNYVNFYGNLITHCDHQVNTVLDVLYQVYDTIPRRSLADNTIVIRTADHGEMVMAPGGMRQKILHLSCFFAHWTWPLFNTRGLFFLP